MTTPLQIVFTDIPPSDAIEAAVREKVDKLAVYFDRITACRVTIDRVNAQHHKGNVFRVQVELTVPGEQVAATRDRGLDHAHEDVYVAIRNSFDAARRQLKRIKGRRKDAAKPRRRPARASAED